MNITCKHDLDDKVVIKPLEKTGYILSIWIDRKGLRYQVRYLHSAEMKENYFYENELKKEIKKGKKTGF